MRMSRAHRVAVHFTVGLSLLGGRHASGPTGNTAALCMRELAVVSDEIPVFVRWLVFSRLLLCNHSMCEL